MTGNTKILAIVPAFNEEANIAQVIKDLQGLSLLDIVVIDDGSTDHTAKIAKDAGAHVVSLPFNLGIGAAVQTGYSYARLAGYAIAVQVDADGQHDAQYVPKLIAPILSGDRDVVIGSRFLPPFLGYRSSWARRIGISFFARLISVLTGVQVTDPTSGFRACNRMMIDVFSEDYPSDFPEPEAIVEAKNAHARISEIAVMMRPRLTGHSSIRYLKTGYYMIKVTFAILLRSIKRQNKKGQA